MHPSTQRGFTIVEMMVGLAIGLIGLLAVAQIFVVFNQQRNTATQTMEAQSNGVMALYLLERDIAQAGYGLMNLQDCADSDSGSDSDGDGPAANDQDIHWYYSPAGCTSGCGVQTPLSSKPVIIMPGGAGVSDSLIVQYAKATTGAPGSSLLDKQTAASDPYKVTSVAGFSQEDLAVVNVAGSCTLFQVTNVNEADRQLAHTNSYSIISGGATETRTSSYNPTVLPSPGWDVAQADNVIVNFGGLMSRRYSVSANAALQMQGYLDAAPTTLTEGIVYLKAQYGINNSGGSSDKSVDLWSTDLSSITSGGRVDYSRVLAIRVGVVARSPLYEKEAVNAPATLTVLPEITNAGGAVIGAAETFDVPDTHYRYRVYSTVIPLRNVIWGG